MPNDQLAKQLKTCEGDFARCRDVFKSDGMITDQEQAQLDAVDRMIRALLDPDGDDERTAYSLRGSVSTKRRREVTKLAEARNAVEAAETEAEREKLQRKYDKMLKALGGSVSTDKVDKKVPLEAYRDQLKEQVGPELDKGSAVVVLIKGHYVRLQAIHDDHVIVDDPGRNTRSNLKVTYDEARGMGYFISRLVLG